MEVWRELATAQAGALTRQQAVAAGLHPATVDREVLRGHWQRLQPGVLATFSGPVPPLTRVWAAVLSAGRGAVACGRTAAWLHGLVDELPPRLEVAVPADRRVRSQPGVLVRHSRELAREPPPPRSPPRTRIEDTVLDLVAAARDPRAVVDVVLRACQRRLSTADRLRAAAKRRPRLRHRALLMDVLADAVAGVQSPLERSYRRDVELAHGLPRGTYNRGEGQRGGRKYRDVVYERFGVVVELDGSAAHPGEAAHLDRARDREVVLAGAVPLRFGWYEVVVEACCTASEVARLLVPGGWRGRPVRCGRACRLPGT